MLFTNSAGEILIVVNNKYNIVYLCTYLNDELSHRFNLPFVPSGLKKKNSLIKSLAAHNVQVVFVSIFSQIPGRIFRGFIANNKLVKLSVPWFTTIPLINYLLNPIFVFYKIKRLNNSRKIDFLILYNCVYENVIPAIFAKYLFKTKIIVQYEDGWIREDKGFLKNILYRGSHSLAQRIASGLLTNSKTFLDIFSSPKHCLFRGSVDHLERIPHMCSSENKLNVLFASTIDEVRGAKLIIKFLDEICDKELFDSVKISIVGRGKKELTKILDNSVLAYRAKGGDAEFYGFVTEDDLKRIYSETDVFLSLQDPACSFSKYCFPSKILEFYYYNKPVIATDISDIYDFFPHLVLTDYDVIDLRDKIIFCLHNQGELEALNAHNLDFVINEFSDKENSKKISNFLDEIYE